MDIPLYPVSKGIFEAESYPLDQIRMVAGGDALNESTILTRLGHTAALLSMVGQDAAGSYILSFCKENRVHCQGIAVDPEVDTSINIGLVAEDGERTFVTNRNGSLWRLEERHIRTELFEGARLLSLASIFNHPRLNGPALVRLFHKAKTHGMTVCADMIHPRLGESLDDIREALSYVDYFFPNYAEACLLTGQQELKGIAQVLLDVGVRHVVIKTGRKGCYFQDQEQAFCLPACPGIQAVDTIGAGDNFAAAFLAGLLEGLSHRECALLGNAAASIAVQYAGATAGVRERSQVDARLAEYRQKIETEGEANR